MISKTNLRYITTFAFTGILVLSGCSSENDASASNGAPDSECEPRWEFDTIEPGVLNIAAVQQMPASNVDPQTGELSGLDPVLLERFASEACLTTSWDPMSGPAASAALTEGVADIGAGGFFKSEARGEVMGQTTATWLDAPGVLSGEEPITSIEDMVGKRVGVVGGAVFEEPLGEVIGPENVIPYQSLDAMIEDLSAQRIDAALNSGGVLTFQKSERNLDNELTLLSPDPDYPVLTAPGEPNLPHTKTNTSLGNALDEFLAEAQEDGTVVETLESYGIDDPQLP